MPPKKRFISCQICGDRATRKNREKRMFMARFPLDEARCKQWVKVVGKEDLIYVPIEKLHTLKYVCGNHFKDKDFNKKRNRLKKTAVPSKNLKATPLSDDMLTEFPCHIASDIDVTKDYVPQRMIDKTDKSPSIVQIEPVAGTSNSESYNLEQQETERLSDEEILQKHSRKRSCNSEPFTSALPCGSNCLLDHDYFSKEETIIPLKRKKVSNAEPFTSALPCGSNCLLDHDYFSKEETITPLKRKKVSNADAAEVSPRRKQLIKKILMYKRKIRLLKEGNVMPHIKSVALKCLIKAYIRNRGRKPQGKRWTPIEKALAIAIYKKSPRVFRHLRHLMALPSVRTLQNLLQTMELEPGVSKITMNHLKKKTEKLNTREKLCSLLFDEIALKKRLIFNPRTDKVEGFVDLGENQCRSPEVADHALVFMLQGLHKKFKQPIAFYFVKGTISTQSLAVIIKDVIKAVNGIGYTVVTTVCDQGPTNIGSLNLLKRWCNIPATSNYFLVEDEKIFIMFDIPHLFKSLRNNFHNGGVIILDGKKGQWSHLLDVAEKNKQSLNFKKLTSLHVNPTFKTKMKVKLAAQVLSNTVSAILKLMAEACGDDDKGKEILETAQIVEDLDRLFDCTNGPSSKKDIVKGRRENVSKKTNHVELWRRYSKIMSTMVFLKADSFLRLKNVRCVNGYLTSLKSLENIWEYVQSKGFKYLNLRQLNQDSLENLFGMIRQHCPTNRNPTCHHFTAGLKSNMLTKLSAPVGRGANCEEDENEAIIDFEDFFQEMESKEKNLDQKPLIAETPFIQPLENSETPVLHLPENVNFNRNLELHFDDDFHFDDAELLRIESSLFETFEKQPTVYVAGYLASVVLKKLRWQCENCKQSLKIVDPELYDQQLYSYINLREWWQDKRSLTYPTLNLCKLVDTATSCFEAAVKPILHQENITQQAVTLMLVKCDNLLWVCNNHKDQLLQILLTRLSHLLIRNECHRRNLSFAKAEEFSSDVLKKAQQQGIAKS